MSVRGFFEGAERVYLELAGKRDHLAELPQANPSAEGPLITSLLKGPEREFEKLELADSRHWRR
jgi:hypothetical protein